MFIIGVVATNRNCTHVAMHKTLDIKAASRPLPASSFQLPCPDLFCPSRGWISRFCAQNANAEEKSMPYTENQKKGLVRPLVCGVEFNPKTHHLVSRHLGIFGCGHLVLWLRRTGLLFVPR